MNITTHNENRGLVDTVGWDDDPVSRIALDGGQLMSILGDPYWYEGDYPCWWVANGTAQFLIRQSFPEEVEDLGYEDNWCVISDFPSTAQHLVAHLVMTACGGPVTIKVTESSRVHIGKSTKLPLPDRRTA